MQQAKNREHIGAGSSLLFLPMNILLLVLLCLLTLSSAHAQDTLQLTESERQSIGPLQRLAEILGHWEVERDSRIEQSRAGDVWTFNRDASFISRNEQLRRGEAHYRLNLNQLEISQSGQRRQFELLLLLQDRMQLRALGDNSELLLRRTDTPAGQQAASIYYTPRQVALMKILLTCGIVQRTQLESLFPEHNEKQINGRKLPLLESDPGLRDKMRDYLFKQVGIRQFEWPVFLASEQYYSADKVYNAVFPGIIKRGVRRCLN